MRALLLYFSFRHLRAHKLRTALGFFAIALGVSLFVSSRLATTSVTLSIQRTMENLSGKAQWQVTRGRSVGIEEGLFDRVRSIPGAIAAPIVQSQVRLVDPPGAALLVLGIDILHDALLRLYKFEGKPDPKAMGGLAFAQGGIVLTRRFAADHGLAAGSVVRAQTHDGVREIKVTGLLDDEGPARVFGGGFALMEIHAAQRLFGRAGLFDRIEVAGVERAALEQACPGYSVSPMVRTSSIIEDALLRVKSLIAVGVIALFVGLFIIYNSVLISVVERIKEIGTLRAIGATRGQILSTLILEWFFLGSTASLAGLGIGWLLARALVKTTARSVNMIVNLAEVREIIVTPFDLSLALGVGVGASLCAAYFPARQAMQIQPIELFRPNRYRLSTHSIPVFFLGLGLSGLAASLLPLIRYSPPVGLIVTGIGFVGVALMLPVVTLKLSQWTRPALRRFFRVEGYLAADNVSKFPQRTALTVTALGGALGMMVASATLVQGFRTATFRWLDDALPFDIAVSANDFSASVYGQNSVEPGLIDTLRAVPGVDLVYGVRTVFSDFRDEDVMLVSVETEPFVRAHERRKTDRWRRYFSDEADMRLFETGEGIFVSRNLAFHTGVKEGQEIELPTPSGPTKFKVLNAMEDYSWSRGVVMMDRRAYARLWKDESVNFIDLGLAPGVTKETARDRISAALSARHSLYVYTVAEMKAVSEQILNQTVALANIQVVIAILIGFLGILNTLLISVLRRTREIGLLRAVGMTRAQIGRTILIEGVFISLVGGLVGAAGGLAGGWLPLRLFTLSMTGYLIPIVVPWVEVAASAGFALLIGIVASVFPARHAAGLNVLEAIGYE